MVSQRALKLYRIFGFIAVFAALVLGLAVQGFHFAKSRNEAEYLRNYITLIESAADLGCLNADAFVAPVSQFHIHNIRKENEQVALIEVAIPPPPFLAPTFFTRFEFNQDGCWVP